MRHEEKLVCQNCGKVFYSRIKNVKFCSHICANQRNCARLDGRVFKCKYNQEVYCSAEKCGSCGWNPKVAKKRTEILMSRMEGAI